jgi:hypothetical protein
MSALVTLALFAAFFESPAVIDESPVFAGTPSPRLAPVVVTQRGATLRVTGSAPSAVEVTARATGLPAATCPQDEAGVARVALPALVDDGGALVIIEVEGLEPPRVSSVSLPARAASRALRVGDAGCRWAVVVATGTLVVIDAGERSVETWTSLVEPIADASELDGGVLLRELDGAIVAGDAFGELALVDRSGSVARASLPARALPRAVVDEEQALWLLTADGVLWSAARDELGELVLTQRASSGAPARFGLVPWRGLEQDRLVWASARGALFVWDGEALDRMGGALAAPRTPPLVFDVDDDGALEVLAFGEDGLGLVLRAGAEAQRVALGAAPTHALVHQQHADAPVTLALALGDDEGIERRLPALPAAGLWREGVMAAPGLQVASDGTLFAPRFRSAGVTADGAPVDLPAPEPPLTAEPADEVVCACVAAPPAAPATSLLGFAVVALIVLRRRGGRDA